MSDHVVLYVDRLTRPDSVQENGEEAIEPIRGAGESETEAGPSCSAEYAGDEEMGENEPLLQMGECRICQEEDSINNLETPCGCSGSLKFAHRKCVQRWCNEKGDIICEICHQQYEPNYIAPPPQPRTEDTAIEIGGGWTISGNSFRLRDPRLLAVAEAERHFLEAEYDEYDSSNASGAAFCRSVALILVGLLLLRHALSSPDADGEDDDSTFFSLFLLQAAGFLLPFYIMAWAINILQRRRQRQEAAAQVAFVLQSGHRRDLQFTIASGSNDNATQPLEIV